MTDEILPVKRFARDTDGSWVVKCPHCKATLGVEDGEEDGTPRGEQYQHTSAFGCNGWFEVTDNAAYVRGEL